MQAPALCWPVASLANTLHSTHHFVLSTVQVDGGNDFK